MELKIISTYNKSDILGQTFIGNINVSEKRWYYNKSLKETTLDKFKMLADKKGGNIVYIPYRTLQGWGLFVTHTVTGYIYKKVE